MALKNEAEGALVLRMANLAFEFGSEFRVKAAGLLKQVS